MDWLDRLPATERMKIRNRFRTPEEYEKLREKVKGPEDLEREMDRNERLAELHFLLETEPAVHEALAEQIRDDIGTHGIDAVLEMPGDASPELLGRIREGKGIVQVSGHPSTGQDALVVAAEGVVQEKIPLKKTFSDRYVSQLTEKH